MTRRLFFLGIAAIVASGASVAMAQSPSQGTAAIQRAAAADKYLFVFFWREKSQQTDAMWGVLQSAMSKAADRAEFLAVNVTDSAEKPMLDKFGVDRSPMPLVLALAPNGAITKGFPSKSSEEQLLQAFVSPGTAKVLKGLQARKLVLLSVQSRPLPARPVSLQQGVADFVADARFAEATEVVTLDPADPAEASFLKDLQVDPGTKGQTTVFLAPPGSLVGKFDGPVSKEQLIAKLQEAQSNPCAGGMCGPGGCGPKK